MGGYQDALLAGISRLFNSRDHADINVCIGQYEMPCHGLVLTSQSKYFSSALASGFDEARSREFKFMEGSCQAYWRVFEYMYTGEYSEEPSKALNSEDDDGLMKDVQVYGLADYFIIDSLKDHALKKFETKMEKLWTHESFITCIRHVYKHTQDSDRIRVLVVDFSRRHLDALWKSIAFRDLIREGGDFAVDLIARDLSGSFC